MDKSNQNSSESDSRAKSFLTSKDLLLIRRQIRLNSLVIDRTICTIDLLINRERCPEDARPLLQLRRRLDVAMSENDTFRRVLWRYVQSVETGEVFEELDAVTYLVRQIRSRKNAIFAQSAMK